MFYYFKKTRNRQKELMTAAKAQIPSLQYFEQNKYQVVHKLLRRKIGGAFFGTRCATRCIQELSVDYR